MTAMASPHLAIAKVSLSAVLLRPDPTSCPRNELDDFLSLLDVTISRCSTANVQKSKRWILKHVIQSPARITALGKYFTALANSFSTDVTASRQAREPSSKRKRLHILYLLNDVLYHVHVRDRDDSFSPKLEPFLPGLVQSAAAFSNCPKHTNKVLDLVKAWDERGYFPASFVSKIQDTARDAPNSQLSSSAAIGSGLASAGSKTSRDAPFIMPSIHGDATIPWYDLPAANWLPVIEPNSIRPMNPALIKPLQFRSGPADKDLVKAVKDLLADVDRIYAKDHRLGDDPSEDVDQLGQRIVVDESTRDIISGETYYGWSRGFCEKMKQRRRKANGSGEDRRGRDLSRSRSRSSSRSSQPTFKRRRVSGSHSPSGSRSRRRSLSRERRRDRSYSASRSRSPSRDRRHQRSASRSRGRSPQREYGEARGNSNPNFQNQHPGHPPPPQLMQNFAGGNGAFHPPPFLPAPPPRPPGWQGEWPPPPPPPLLNAGQQPWMPGVPPMPSWGGPAPPPPPPPQYGQQQHQNSGYQYGRGGRGDFRGGRGAWQGGNRGW